MGAATRIGGNDRVGPAPKDSWLAWAAFVVPAFATALTWRVTAALPFVNRVAIAVAVALVIYGVVHVIAKGSRR
jgi:hypothetical protein